MGSSYREHTQIRLFHSLGIFLYYKEAGRLRDQAKYQRTGGDQICVAFIRGKSTKHSPSKMASGEGT